MGPVDRKESDFAGILGFRFLDRHGFDRLGHDFPRCFVERFPGNFGRQHATVNTMPRRLTTCRFASPAPAHPCAAKRSPESAAKLQGFFMTTVVFEDTHRDRILKQHFMVFGDPFLQSIDEETSWPASTNRCLALSSDWSLPESHPRHRLFRDPEPVCRFPECFETRIGQPPVRKTVHPSQPSQCRSRVQIGPTSGEESLSQSPFPFGNQQFDRAVPEAPRAVLQERTAARSIDLPPARLTFRMRHEGRRQSGFATSLRSRQRFRLRSSQTKP